MPYPNQFYFPQNYPQYQQNFPQQQTQPQPMQIQNGGFVSIRGEQEARNYPIAVGTSITFKDETAPYIYTKTMGFSQLDLPQFDKYRLVKEDGATNAPDAHTDEVDNKTIDLSPYAKHDEIDALQAQIDALKNEVDELKSKKGKKENVKDE